MPMLSLLPACRADAGDRVQAHLDSRTHHQPWTWPFTTLDGFEEWFASHLTGASVGFVARELSSGGIVGVTNLSQIFLKGFQNAYLGYYGMAAFAGRGFMTKAVRMTVARGGGGARLPLPRQRAPRRLSVIRSILSYARHPEPLLLNGAWTRAMA